MRIRYGCELSFVVDRPTAAYCLVDIHPDRRVDIVEEQPLRAAPQLGLTVGHDAFGNISGIGYGSLAMAGLHAGAQHVMQLAQGNAQRERETPRPVLLD